VNDLASRLGSVNDWFRTGNKMLRFALAGAVGCFLGAVVGELLLAATRTRPQKPPSQAVCLLIDCSGSMNISSSPSEVNVSKLREVKAAAGRFVDRQDLARDRIAVVGFGSGVRPASELSGDAQRLHQAIESLYDGGSTAMDAGLNIASSQLRSDPEESPDSSTVRNILLFTDGQPDDQEAALGAAQMCRERDIRIVAIATGDADVDYLAQITGDPALVFPTNAGNFDEGFKQAEEAIFGGSLVESSPTRTGFLASLLQIGAWTALLAVGVSLALVASQNHYVRRNLLTRNEALIGTVGGVCAGVVGGAAGQLLFTAALGISTLPLVGSVFGWLLTSVGRIIGWAILGALVARGLAFFVPNIEPRRAWWGGGTGGAAAAVAFLIASLLGDTAGRFLGAAILGAFIGLMVAFVEAAFRQAWLEVRYGLKEVIYVSLGAKPVRIGSDRSCTVYARGARPVAYQYRFEDGMVVCLDYATETSSVVEPGDEKQVGSATVIVRTSAARADRSGAGSEGEAAPPAGRGTVQPLPPPPKPKASATASTGADAESRGTSTQGQTPAPTAENHPAEPPASPASDGPKAPSSGGSGSQPKRIRPVRPPPPPGGRT